MSRDYLAPGDGLLTVDLDNGLEYLDLSQTLFDRFPGALAEDRYQAIVAETAEGGRFASFEVANPDQANALLLSAGVTTTSSDFAINGDAVRSLVESLSATEVSSRGDEVVNSALDELAFLGSPNPLRTSLLLVYRPSAGPSESASGIVNFGYDTVAQEYPGEEPLAALLVRRSIPEPHSGLLAVLAAVPWLSRAGRN